jgi:hypothetical protein
VHLTTCGALGAEYARLSKISRASIVFDAALPLIGKPFEGYSATAGAKSVFLLRYSMFLAYEGEKDAR